MFKHKKLLILAGIIFFTTVGYLAYKNRKVEAVVNKSIQTTETQRPLGFSYSWDGPALSRTTIQLNQDSLDIWANVDNINMNPANSNVEMTIAKDKYPKMFLQGIANFSQIDAFQLPDFRDKYDGNLIMIENTQPDHGGMSPTYTLIVSPFEGKVVFETPEYFSHVRFPMIEDLPLDNFLRLNFTDYSTDSCISCQINFLETYDYNIQNSKFVLANNKHIEEFAKYLIQYQKMEESGCFFEGQKRSFIEIRKLGGDDATCQSSDMTQISNPLSMRKFYAIKDRLQRIVNGENITMFE